MKKVLRRKSDKAILLVLDEVGEDVCVEEWFEFADGGPSPRPLKLWHKMKDYEPL